MAFKELEFTQSVWHYQALKRKFWQETGFRVLGLYLQATDAQCPKCKSRDVAAYAHRVRTLVGLPNGKCQVRFIVPVRKIVCRACHAATYERVPFAAYKNARITRALAKKLLNRAAATSMKSLAEEYHIAWRTVRDAIEDGLRKRYRKRDYSKVVNIGIDELYVFRHERPNRRFITTVRDQDGEGVLEVARGKGVVALKRFERKIGPYKDNIKSISMDMSSSFNLWAETFLPNAVRIIDKHGDLKWKGVDYFLSEALRGERVGLYPLDDHTYEVRFAEHILGTVDIRAEMFAPRVKAGSKQPYIKGWRVQRAEITEGD